MDFLSILGNIVHLGLPLFGSTLVGLAVWALKTKLHLQITAEQEKLLTDVLSKAIGFAEEWAGKQVKANPSAPAPSGADKLKQATDFVTKEITRIGIKLDPAQVDGLLHAALGLIRA